MERYEIQKLRDLPIEGVSERLGLRVVRHKSLCPFHDDHTPSLTFNVARNNFRCYACGAHGGVIDLAIELLRLPFTEVCRWLANEHNVILTEYKPQPSAITHQPFDSSRFARYFEHPWLSPDACKFLFGKRHLHPAVIRYCRLNSFRDWLQIPYYNQGGELIGIQSRYMGTDPEQPRFRFPYGNACHIYNLPVLKMLKDEDNLYITEGCSDCWAMLSAGHKAIAIPSATLLKPKDKELLSVVGCQLSIHFHMYPDRDEPGERLFLQLQEMLPNLVRHDLPNGCKDFSDYWTSQALSVKC